MELTNIIFKDYLKTKKIILHDQFSYFCSDDYFDYFRSTNHRILANRIHKINDLANHCPLYQAHYVTSYDLYDIAN